MLSRPDLRERLFPPSMAYNAWQQRHLLVYTSTSTASDQVNLRRPHSRYVALRSPGSRRIHVPTPGEHARPK